MAWIHSQEYTSGFNNELLLIHTLPTDQQFNLEFLFKAKFNLEFQFQWG